MMFVKSFRSTKEILDFYKGYPGFKFIKEHKHGWEYMCGNQCCFAEKDEHFQPERLNPETFCKACIREQAMKENPNGIFALNMIPHTCKTERCDSLNSAVMSREESEEVLPPSDRS
jgi:hypothetical protein